MYIVNKEKTKLFYMDKNLTLRKKGIFYTIVYDGETEVGSYFTQKEALDEMNSIIRQLKKEKGVIQLTGFNTEKADCNRCDFLIPRKGCKFGDKKTILKKCPYLNGQMKLPMETTTVTTPTINITESMVINKEEPKQEIKVEPKQEIKVEPKQEIKVEPKKDIKEESKQEVKVEPKKEEKTTKQANVQTIIYNDITPESEKKN